MKRILLYLTQTKVWQWFILKALPYLRFTTQLNNIEGYQYNLLADKLFPGAIVLSTDREKLASILVPGITSHAELCVDGVEKRMVGMTHVGFTESFIFDTCKDSDRVIILKCVDWSEEFVNLMVKSVYMFRYTPYDTMFSLGVAALYCSELIYQIDKFVTNQLYKKAGTTIDVDLSDIENLGMPYLSPDGLLVAKNVVCVWDSDDEFTGLTGPEIEKLIS